MKRNQAEAREARELAWEALLEKALAVMKKGSKEVAAEPKAADWKVARGGIAEATTGLCQRLAGCAPAHGRGIRRQPLRLRNASRRTAERTGRLRAPNRKNKVMTPFPGSMTPFGAIR